MDPKLLWKYEETTEAPKETTRWYCGCGASGIGKSTIEKHRFEVHGFFEEECKRKSEEHEPLTILCFAGRVVISASKHGDSTHGKIPGIVPEDGWPVEAVPEVLRLIIEDENAQSLKVDGAYWPRSRASLNELDRLFHEEIRKVSKSVL